MSQLCLYLAADEPMQPGSGMADYAQQPLMLTEPCNTTSSSNTCGMPSPAKATHPIILLSMAASAAAAALGASSSAVRETKENFYQAISHLLLKRWALVRPRIVGDCVASALTNALQDPFDTALSFATCYTTDCVVGAEALVAPPDSAFSEFAAPPSEATKPAALLQLIKRVHRTTKCSAECFPTALVLLDRYYRSTHERIDRCNAPRLFLVSLMVATKLRDDRFFKNAVWAEQVGLLPLPVLNSLEVKFLCAIRYKLFVSVADYLHFEEIVLDTVAQFAEGDDNSVMILTSSSSSPAFAVGNGGGGVSGGISPAVGCGGQPGLNTSAAYVSTPTHHSGPMRLMQPLNATVLGGMGLTPLQTPTVTPMALQHAVGQMHMLGQSYDSYGPEGESAQPTPQAPLAPVAGQPNKLSMLLQQPLSAPPPPS